MGPKSSLSSRRAVLASLVPLLSGCTSIRSNNPDEDTTRQMQSGTEWPMVGGTLENTSEIRNVSPSDGLSTKWTKSFGSDFLTPPILSKSEILVVGQDSLMALSKKNGDLNWRTKVPGNIGGAPVLCDDLVIVPRDPFGEGFDEPATIDDAHLYAIDRDSSELLWSIKLDGEKAYSVVGSDELYCQTSTALYRVSKNGEVDWQYTYDDLPDLRTRLSSIRPVVGPDEVYTICSDGVCRFDRETGERIWSRPVPDVRYPPTLTSANTLVLSSQTETFALEVASGDRVWSLNSWSNYSPAASGSTVIVPFQEEIQAVHPETGELFWKRSVSNLEFEPVIIGGVVLVRTASHDILLFDLQTGDERGSTQTDGLVRALAPSSRGLYTIQTQSAGVNIISVGW